MAVGSVRTASNIFSLLIVDNLDVNIIQLNIIDAVKYLCQFIINA
jgi:hypothetical protein